MKKKPCSLYAFMESVNGNWRNAIYVECNNNSCNRDKACTGFVLAFNSDGHPMIMPVKALAKLSGTVIDATECLARIDRSVFETIFSRWLAWELSQSGDCILNKPDCFPKCIKN